MFFERTKAISIVESKPATLPDDEYAMLSFDVPHEYGFRWSERIYEQVDLKYAQTTNRDTVILPNISYPNFSEFTRPPRPRGFLAGMKHVVRERRDMRDAKAGNFDPSLKVYFSDLAGLPESTLSKSQLRAITRAAQLQKMRENGDPLVTSFSFLRRMDADEAGLLYVAAEREGNGMDTLTPAAAVKSATFIGDIDFATATQGYPGCFRYHQSDIDSFIPDDMRAVTENPDDTEALPNAYVFMNAGRNVTTDQGDYQLTRLRLFNVQTDMEFPLTSLRLPPTTII